MEHLEIIHTDINALHPNPWNPNHMDEKQYRAATQSINTYGFIDPVTVRAHPEITDEYQIIDGEHRWRVAQDANHATVPIIVIDATDEEAKKLTIILNETRGEANIVEIAQILQELGDDYEAIANALPYDAAEIDNMIAMLDYDWEAALNHEEDENPTEQDNSEFTTFTLKVPTEALNVIKQARDLIEQETTLHATENIAWGQVLELLAADYISGS